MSANLHLGHDRQLSIVGSDYPLCGCVRMLWLAARGLRSGMQSSCRSNVRLSICTPFGFAGYDDARQKGSFVLSHSSRADM
jgi:hypothetical protein